MNPEKYIFYKRNTKEKFVILILVIALIEFLVILNNQFYQSDSFLCIQQKSNLSLTFDVSEIQSQNIKEFLEFGEKTDKTFRHHYETIYGNLLGPLRNKKLNFLEIGLGCGMHQVYKNYPPGISLELWRRYLPKANISIFEYDETCASKFKDRVENMFIGDQTNIGFVQSIGKKYGPFDFIVDDGCHSRTCQINALVGFWPHVKSKGIYLMEDIIHSFEGGKSTSLDLIFQIIVLFNQPTISSNLNLNQDNTIPINKYASDIVNDLESIHCYSHACAFIKK